jgi:Amt family ammonium transporter
VEVQLAETSIELVRNAWVIISATLVLFMQAGFLCLEAGSVRHKNTINVALKNIMDLCISFAIFFVIGYSFMFGESTLNGLIGMPDPFIRHADHNVLLSFLFQVTFCSTAVTIVSGAIAERCRFLPYFLISFVIGLFIYPVFGHWVWGGGWLSQLGYYDFAGSSVVHILGAGVALSGIICLGARNGRFDNEGKKQNIQVSNMPMVALGVIILMFGWIGFNGGSAEFGFHTATIVTNTLLAACFGGLIAMLCSWVILGLVDVQAMLNGVIGGLVAITASANVVTPQAAALIGLAGGFIVPVATALLDKLQLDDVVGAIPAHGAAGIVGILLVPVFITPEALVEINSGLDIPLSRLGFLMVQALGVTVCVIWSVGLGYVFWKIIANISALRVGTKEEYVGLNYSEHMISDPLQDLNIATNLVIHNRTDEARLYFEKLEKTDLSGLSISLRRLLSKNFKGL